MNFAKIKEQMSQRLASAKLGIQGNGMIELHKYAKEKFRYEDAEFNRIVGVYDAMPVCVDRLTLTLDEVRLKIRDYLMTSELGDSFSRLVSKNDDVIVGPTEYTVVNDGSVSKIPMIDGLPATEDPSFVEAHKTLTMGLLLSKGVDNDVVTEDGMIAMRIAPGITDRAEVFYPAFSVMTLHPVFVSAYEGSTGMLEVRDKLLRQARETQTLTQLSTLAKLSLQFMVSSLKSSGPFECRWDRFDVIREDIPQELRVVHSFPPVYGKMTLVQLHDAIKCIGRIRGYSNQSVNVLTNAVYYGELGALHDAVIGAVNMIHIMRHLGIDAVYKVDLPLFVHSWEIISLNVAVIVRNASFPLYAGESHGVFSPPVSNSNNILRILGRSQCGYRTKVPYTRAGLTQALETDSPTVVLVYPYDALWENGIGCIYPVLADETGHVWVSNVNRLAISKESFIARMLRQLSYKAYYPFTMRKFSADDSCHWPSVYVKRRGVTLNNFKSNYIQQLVAPLRDQFYDKILESAETDNVGPRD